MSNAVQTTTGEHLYGHENCHTLCRLMNKNQDELITSSMSGSALSSNSKTTYALFSVRAPYSIIQALVLYA